MCVCVCIYIYILLYTAHHQKKNNCAYGTDFNQFGAPRGVVDGCPGMA